MWTYVAIPLICSLCAIVALPRRSHPDDEVAVWPASRHRTRQHLLVLLALFLAVVLLLVLLVTVPLRASPAAPTVPPCWLAPPDDPFPCGPAQQGDVW